MKHITRENEVIDFTNCPRSYRSYGGSDKKFGVIYNDESWMLKFSEAHAKKSDISTSYVNSPVSEYISSHIIKTLDLPVHDTVLGEYNEELVVGCRDFRKENDETIEFCEFIRAKYDSSEVKRIVILDQVHKALHENNLPNELIQDATERFWDMFVADALIGNFDRHMGNWAFLSNKNVLTLAPIYDCGSSLLPQIADEGMKSIYNNSFEILKRCLVYPSSSLALTKEKIGKAGYYDFLASGWDNDCTEAVMRICPRVDLKKINSIIDETPLITDTRKMFYKKYLSFRKEYILDRAYERCLMQNFDKDALERLQTGANITEDEVRGMARQKDIINKMHSPITKTGAQSLRRKF